LKTTISQQILAVLSVAGIFITLSSCAVSPSSWEKKSSPWDQRRSAAQNTAVPAAEKDEQEIAEVDQSSNEIESDYQSEQVDNSVSEPEAVETESVEAESVEVESVEAEPESMSTEEEVLNLPAEYYTVQLMASVDVDRLHKFAEKNQISVRYIVRTVRDGITWHVLLLDVYPDRASAKIGLDEIVDSVQTQPWLRSLGSIQKLMQ